MLWITVNKMHFKNTTPKEKKCKVYVLQEESTKYLYQSRITKYAKRRLHF